MLRVALNWRGQGSGDTLHTLPSPGRHHTLPSALREEEVGAQEAGDWGS